MRTFFTTLGITAAGITAALTVAACTTTPPDGSGPRAAAASRADGAPPAEVARLADPVAARRGLELWVRISRSLQGTAGQRLAAERGRHDRWENGIAACLAGQGLPYAKQPFPGSSRDPQGVDDLSTPAPLSPGGFGLAAAARHGAEVHRQMLAQEAATPELWTDRSYLRARRDCGNHPREDERRSLPVQRMYGELSTIFKTTEALPEVATALHSYGECLRSAGFAADTYLEIFLLATEKYQTGPQRDAAGFEQRAAGRDAVCRRPVQDLAMAAAAPRLEAFAAVHGPELRATRTRWEVVSGG